MKTEKFVLVNIILSSIIIVFNACLLVKPEPTLTCDCANDYTSNQSVLYQENFGEVEVKEPAQLVTAQPYYIEKDANGFLTAESIASMCDSICELYSIDPKLLQAVAWHESRYNPNAKGSSGDSGLCQIIPTYHMDIIERLGINDIFDPYSNLLVSACLLSSIKDNTKYGYDMRYVLMAYNMGSETARNRYENGYISDYANAILQTYQELGGVL